MSRKYIDIRTNVRFYRHPEEGTIHGECELVILSITPKYELEPVPEKEAVKVCKNHSIEEHRTTVTSKDLDDLINTLEQVRQALNASDELAEGINGVIKGIDEEE